MAERKAIFITGGGSGIGRAVAQRFAREGWFVGLADISESGMRETAALLPAGVSSTHRLDVRDRLAWDEALADFAEQTGGRIDVMFNNAGVAFSGPLSEMQESEIDMLVDVNFRGVIYGAQAARPYLANTPGSCLLNTASAAGLYGIANMATYSATKFGVRAITEALDVEWAADGIKVRDLMPGFIDTPLLEKPGNSQTNVTMRDNVVDAKIDFIPVEDVSQAAWDAVHGKKVHSLVGKTAKQLSFMARFAPGLVRRRSLAPME
ncbi:MAG: SDR family oxidoreductase [Sphingomonadales bacterium]|nr:SDR family oxidoreductase [Sphingomonadales bacterium]MDE2567593.1 SDR family oxidoreductase [Sphingomonadales bacterium]